MAPVLGCPRPEPARLTGDPDSAGFVLVVEDDPDIRFLALEALDSAGIDAIQAENADVALELLNRRTDIRSVFTDIDMPGTLDGIALAEIVRNRWPTMRIVVTSGRYMQTATLPGNIVFLAKPYHIRDLVLALKGCVEYRN